MICVHMCYGLSHCIAMYFVFRLYDSALAICNTPGYGGVWF